MKLKFPLVLSLTIALSLAAPSAQAAVKKPSAPTITSVTSSAVKKGLVNVVVSISLPSNNGGSKILGSQVTGGGKSCTISATKTSCTLKGIKKDASLSLKASSKNKIGFGKNSSAVKHKAGGAAYSAETRTPTFGTTTTTATGFIVQISNYDAAWTWAGTATANGTVAISATGLVTVSGVAASTSSIATITPTLAGWVGVSATSTQTSLATLTPTFGAKTPTSTGFTVQISNYDAAWTWAGTATASGSVAISGSGLVTVTGVAASTSSTATITATRTLWTTGSATSTATSTS
jgi:titin